HAPRSIRCWYAPPRPAQPLPSRRMNAAGASTQATSGTRTATSGRSSGTRAARPRPDAGGTLADVATVHVEIVQGDITERAGDAAVNPATSRVWGGGGGDGAIPRSGGPEILEETRRLGGCETGDAKASTAGRLPARYVIHTVGPVWRGGGAEERE